MGEAQFVMVDCFIGGESYVVRMGRLVVLAGWVLMLPGCFWRVGPPPHEERHERHEERERRDEHREEHHDDRHDHE